MWIKTKTKVKDIVEKHNEVMKEHKDMLGFHVFVAILVGVALHMLFPPMHSTASGEKIIESPQIQSIITEHHSSKKEIASIEKSLFEITKLTEKDIHTIPSTIQGPNISLKITQDNENGFNGFIGAENFAFTPQKLGGFEEMAYYEGHATLYINDHFIERIYSPYFHIPQSFLTEKENVIVVILNDNIHKPFHRNGELIYDADTIRF